MDPQQLIVFVIVGLAALYLAMRGRAFVQSLFPSGTAKKRGCSDGCSKCEYATPKQSGARLPGN